MSIYALVWTALGFLIAWLAADWLFGIGAWPFLGAVVGWLGGQLVRAWYGDKGKSIDGDSALDSRRGA